MPRQKQPAEIQERKGAFKHNPNRRREDVPGIGAVPDSPPIDMNLSDELVLLWHQVVPLIPPVAGKANDIFAVEMTVRLIHKMRSPEGLNAAEMGRLHALLNTLCLTPTGRANLAVPADKPKKSAVDEFRVVPVGERGKDANAN